MSKSSSNKRESRWVQLWSLWKAEWYMCTDMTGILVYEMWKDIIQSVFPKCVNCTKIILVTSCEWLTICKWITKSSSLWEHWGRVWEKKDSNKVEWGKERLSWIWSYPTLSHIEYFWLWPPQTQNPLYHMFLRFKVLMDTSPSWYYRSRLPAMEVWGIFDDLCLF